MTERMGERLFLAHYGNFGEDGKEWCSVGDVMGTFVWMVALFGSCWKTLVWSDDDFRSKREMEGRGLNGSYCFVYIYEYLGIWV